MKSQFKIGVIFLRISILALALIPATIGADVPLGKNDLADKGEGWLAAHATNHFFKVTVQMPNGVDISDSPGLISVERGPND